jgi:DNA repair protein RadD
MKKTPRPRQIAAYKSIISAWREGEIPYADCVTSFGKSLIIAMLMDTVLNKGKRVLVLVPNKEIVEQNYKEAFEYVEQNNNICICCAMLHSYNINCDAVIATPVSFNNAIRRANQFDVVIVDECDLVGIDEDSIYRKIIRSLQRHNPKLLIAGLTGSPYRQDQGMLQWHPPKNKGVPTGTRLFTKCCYKLGEDYTIGDMIKDGHLSMVETLNTEIRADLSDIKIRGKDYDERQLGVKFGAIIGDAVAETKRLFEKHNIESALIFSSTIQNAEAIVSEWSEPCCRIAHGNLSNRERTSIVEWLKEGEGKRYLVNVGLYTRGFDMPHLQAIVLLRATLSLRLYVQIIGRILRTHESKEYGYLIDYGQHADRFGPIDNLQKPKEKRYGEAPKKICGECGETNLLSSKICKKCQAEFISENDDGLYSMRTKAQILEDKRLQKIKDETHVYDINGVIFTKAFSRTDGTPMIKIIMADDDYRTVHEEYLMLNHSGFPRVKAVGRLMQMLKDVNDYYEIAKEGVTVDNVLTLLNEAPEYFKKIKQITIRPGKNPRYKEMIEWVLI